MAAKSYGRCTVRLDRRLVADLEVVKAIRPRYS